MDADGVADAQGMNADLPRVARAVACASGAGEAVGNFGTDGICKRQCRSARRVALPAVMGLRDFDLRVRKDRQRKGQQALQKGDPERKVCGAKEGNALGGTSDGVRLPFVLPGCAKAERQAVSCCVGKERGGCVGVGEVDEDIGKGRVGKSSARVNGSHGIAPRKGEAGDFTAHPAARAAKQNIHALPSSFRKRYGQIPGFVV